jgi:Glucodextranase, domain B
VHVAVTAPTDGAVVSVRNVQVVGTVDPRRAAVTVGGKRAHSVDGSFRRAVTLQRGVNHIEIVARAPGYFPATQRITVRSSGSISTIGSAGSPAGFPR